LFFRIKKIVKTMDSSNISFLMKLTHDTTSLIALRAYASSKTALGRGGPFGADTIQNKSLKCLKLRNALSAQPILKIDHAEPARHPPAIARYSG